MRINSFLCLFLCWFSFSVAQSETKGPETAVFAGGCFWCMESPFEKLDGVKSVVSGYTGGKKEKPTYKQVSSGRTEHIEAVKVTYDPQVISYKDLLEVFWRNIDPTDSGGQFVDRGEQYISAIFFKTSEEKKIIENSKKKLEKSKRFSKKIVTRVLPAGPFYLAEDYHQDYYKKNPLRYKFYRYNSGRDKFIKKYWGKERSYKPKKSGKSISCDELKKRLNQIEFYVTQNEGTEPPFKNKYWNNKRAGIYIDVVSGEPLFSSVDKFDSGTGWPSFTRPLKKDNVTEHTDSSLFMKRVEVRSKKCDSHLGHVFDDGPAPTGLRYCINSAALRFIPLGELKKEGLEQFLPLFKNKKVSVL